MEPKIVISSGHGLHVPGARSLMDEVTEARRVTNRVAQLLTNAGRETAVYHDDVSRNARDNVNGIVAYHNAQKRLLDVSVHFNAVAGVRQAGIGTETLYRAGNERMKSLSSQISKAIGAASGLKVRRNDGTLARNDLGFLNRTNIDSAILLEICFVNSETDERLYNTHFNGICERIAHILYNWPYHSA